ncbi:MAG: RAMP superfamily CRISPR-associated protein [Candidatus Scalindua sp.]|nr:RAMP superfamily CRISPR-associated protein [Candidatus Scalindua sp.]
MPKEELFWNPYRLIPVEKVSNKKAPITDEKFKERSGILKCTLKNLTPLFVGKNRNNERYFLTKNGNPIIPGTSLKGMFRSLAEVVGNGCYCVDTKEVPDGYERCKKIKQLCAPCRMFGMMEKGQNSKVHKGNVSISDGDLLEKGDTVDLMILLSNCGTRHEPFYRSQNTGELDWKSRKLYFHQPKRKTDVLPLSEYLRKRANPIEALLPGHVFTFDIQFTNLSQEELDLLIYVVALEDNVEVELLASGIEKLRGPLRHKIGHGKPLGLGSCEITISEILFIDTSSNRFKSIAIKQSPILKNEALKKEIEQRTLKHRNDQSLIMKQFRKMMIWDENDPRDFHYPDYNWFKDNSQRELKEI